MLFFSFSFHLALFYLKKGVFYNKKNLLVGDINKADSSLVRDSEEIYEELWKTYFKAISIEGKKNPKLQKNMMPKRYWKNLVEKS